MKFTCPFAFVSLFILPYANAQSTDVTDIQNKLNMLQAQIDALQAELKNVRAEEEKTPEVQQKSVETKKQDGINVGGAVRTNYSHTSYNDGNKNRGGDFDFDLLRVNFSGEIGDISLNAEIRFFDYMTAVKYAYVGYQLDENWQAQLGITKVPFGNWPYNSHSYFFGTTYYVGLEDDHDFGVLLKRTTRDNWQLDLGFFKNDELGGVDGYVEDTFDRYSYDIVGIRSSSEGIYAQPGQAVGEYNTFAGRYAYHIPLKYGDTEIGMSILAGGLHDGQHRAGNYRAWAAHINSHIGQWNVQLQRGQYRYDIDDTVKQIAVGAYAFFDTMAAEATMTNVNVAYTYDQKLGPISSIQFYNDFGIIYDKSDSTTDTWMNVSGLSISAGGVFTYIDLVHAQNQPFVGGSIAGDSNETERRLNINIGYYF